MSSLSSFTSIKMQQHVLVILRQIHISAESRQSLEPNKHHEDFFFKSILLEFKKKKRIPVNSLSTYANSNLFLLTEML